MMQLGSTTVGANTSAHARELKEITRGQRDNTVNTQQQFNKRK
jgi:hypothetical protein